MGRGLPNAGLVRHKSAWSICRVWIHSVRLPPSRWCTPTISSGISPCLMLFTVIAPSFYVLTAWLIAKAVLDGPRASTWGGKLLPELGRCSYGIYLFHLPLLYFSDAFFQGSLASRALFVCLTVFLAWLSWRYFETPIRLYGRMRLKRRAASSLET